MQNRITYFLMLSFLMLCTAASEVQAVNWGNAPLACLPGRAAIWKTGAQPELCHCPPQSMCPSQSTISPANVSFNVYVKSHTTETNFTISGTDVANYYNSLPQNSPYAPFDPTQIFTMQDNINYGCPGGFHETNVGGIGSTGWGAIQDYLTPLSRQYLQKAGVNYNDFTHCKGGYCDGFDSFCTSFDGIKTYNVTVTVSSAVATQISSGAQLPPSLVSTCCKQTFACPQGGQKVQVGQSNSVSCQTTSDSSRLGCLLEGTPVLAASGKNKKVEDIRLGERLKGEHGEVTVTAINKFTQYADEMYGFNGGVAFITSEHPILTTHGWKSINPQLTLVKSGIGSIGKLSVGDEIITRSGTLKITSIEKHAIYAPAIAYNFSVKGGNGFIANNIMVKGFSQVEIHY